MSKTKHSLKKVKRKKRKKMDLFDWRGLGPAPVIGLDEVGRGCLAGPVVAAAVILNSEIELELLSDSKLMTEVRREQAFRSIMTLHSVGVGFATSEEIDQINILQASFLAMRRALEALGHASGHLLVDGHMRIPRVADAFHQTPLVKGDLRCKPISAASIIAKVTRDRHMRELARKYPGYGFEVHKGYATKFHRDALLEKGPCKEHRRSFSGTSFDQGDFFRGFGEAFFNPEKMVD